MGQGSRNPSRERGGAAVGSLVTEDVAIVVAYASKLSHSKKSEINICSDNRKIISIIAPPPKKNLSI